MAIVLGVRLVGVALAVAMGWLPVAPPEHVHEAGDHGTQLLVHRHAGGHQAAHHTSTHDGVVGDDDGPLLTLESVYTVPPPVPALGRPPASVAAILEPLPRLVHWAPEYLERLIHGPPRGPTALRAPPSRTPL